METPSPLEHQVRSACPVWLCTGLPPLVRSAGRSQVQNRRAHLAQPLIVQIRKRGPELQVFNPETETLVFHLSADETLPQKPFPKRTEGNTHAIL